MSCEGEPEFQVVRTENERCGIRMPITANGEWPG